MHRQLLLASALALPVAATPALAQDAQDDAKQGGSMIVTYKDDVSTLDPAIGYDWQNWSMIKSLFDGLMDYAPGTTELIPDLAESYELSADGLTYTFKLHEGVKFHNGRELTADDVKWSIERAVRPETQSPGQGFFGMIAGFDEVAAGETDELSGHRGGRSAYHPLHPVAARCDLPARHGAELLASPCPRRRWRSTARTSATTRSAPAPIA